MIRNLPKIIARLGYVLFRALKDIYHFTPEINDQIPIENLKERYGLNTTWEYYAQEEERFQTELRRRNIYSGFFPLAEIFS